MTCIKLSNFISIKKQHKCKDSLKWTEPVYNRFFLTSTQYSAKSI